MRGRGNKLIRQAGLILGIGLAYAIFAVRTGWYLPCPIHAITGLYCPGCGVTRMCVALLRLDLPGAWRANPILMLLAPVLVGLLLKLGAAYVCTGRVWPTQGENILVWAVVGVLLVFGVLRNLPGFVALRPG